MKRKLFVTLALAALILALTCGAALAAIEGGPLNDEGTVHYENDGSGTIRISGEGATKDYGSSYNLSPLDGKTMTAVEIGAGVTRLGNNLFYGCADLTTATIKNPDAVISGTAFRLCSSLTTICGWEGSTAAAYAAANGYEFSSLGSLTGSCGENVTYSFDPVTGEMTISGTGEMTNFSTDSEVPWFGIRTEITSVVIENGVKSIGSYAFQGCDHMNSVTIPDSVTSIRFMTFYGCSSLNSVAIPDSVINISNWGFAYCTNLTNVTLPSGLTDITDGLFSHTGLTSITIPASVSAIRYAAFHDCTNLTSVTILNPQTYFAPNSIFRNYPASLTLHGWADSTAQTYAQENGITFDAFETSGSCGDSLTYSFDRSTGKMTISGTGAMDKYDSDDDAPWYAFKDCITTLAVEDGVTSVSRMAFCYSANLTSATMAGSVADIGYFAFQNCPSLASVTVLNPACVIGDSDHDVFQGCNTPVLKGWPGSTAQTYAGYSDSNVTFESLSTSGSCGENVTYSFDPVTGTLTISGTGIMMNYLNFITEKPGWYAFREAIQRIVVEEGVASIGVYAFRELTNLVDVSLPNSLDYIETNSFNGCTSLTIVLCPKNIYYIGYEAFINCSSLANVVIYNQDASIGADTFKNCSPALTIHGWADSTAQTYAQENGITFDAFETSGSCGDNLTWSFDASTGELSIGGTGDMTVFGAATEVPWYNIRESVTSVNIGSGVTSVSKRAFYQCTGLTSVTIPSSVTNIGFWAFRDCTGLTSVTIMNPACVIGDSDHDVFQGCNTPVLKGWPGSTAETYAGYADSNVTFESLGALSGSCGDNVTYSFNPTTGVMTISGTGRMTDYSALNQPWPWDTYVESIRSIAIGDGVTNIGNDAFMYGYGLTSVTIPNSVTNIGATAFAYCTGLTSVTIPDGVTGISLGAFIHCSNLTSVSIPNSVTWIGGSAFAYCTGLTSVSIPNSMTRVSGGYNFAYCSNLTSVTFWGPDTEIGKNAFTECPNLTLHGWAGSTAEAYAANTAYPCNFELMAPAPDLFLPAGLKSIEADAFCGVSAEAVVIPKSIQTITGNPFAGSEVLYIYGFPGTAAEDLVESDPIRFMFLPLTDAWYARLTSK